VTFSESGGVLQQTESQIHNALISKIAFAVGILVIVSILSIPVIYMLGSKNLHQHNMHLLYDTFD